MIGNTHSYRRHVVLEEGQINRQTLQLDVTAYVVCDAKGERLGDGFTSLEAAQTFIDQRLDSSK